MEKMESDFLKKLLQTFKVEAMEHLKEITAGLIELEKAPTAESRGNLTEMIFREAHSLKGAARAVNATEIEEICRPLESIFSALKRRELTPSPELFDELHRTIDLLEELLLFLDAAPVASSKPQFEETIENLESALRGELPPSSGEETKEKKPEGAHASGGVTIRTPPEEKHVVSETVRVSTSKLDKVLLQAEELIEAKLAASQRAVELKSIGDRFTSWEKRWAKLCASRRWIERERSGRQHPDRTIGSDLLGLLEFLEWNREFIESLNIEFAELAQAAIHDQRAIGTMVDNLLQETKEVLMLPFAMLLDILPKFIRDLSRDQGKETELVIRGGEIEIDRRILEEMKDPLIHLVRNCLDHGIEKPEERRRKEKAASATITIAISPKNGSYAELLVADDGRGMDVPSVKTTAVRLGVLTEEQAESLADQDALQLVFQSGVTTSPIITDISGRGLGLTIVKEKVEKLGGAIYTETCADAGTTFRIVLPLRLATFRGVLTRVEEHHFILPANNVERVMRVDKSDIKTVENRETIQWNGQAISLLRLQDVLELPRKSGPPNDLLAAVLTSAGKRIAFLVDEVLNEQEVLVKSLGRPLVRVRNIAGATVLGTRKVAPILNVSDLMKSAVRISAAGVKTFDAPLPESEARRNSVLVAEDSITSRALLKNILEASGYEVETAVDGIDAFTKLSSGDFDLVVSDVEMPRMNGFGLTVKIRNDRRLAALPVVLVTALESREDRERGIEAGANAYIVKSSFDQGNLLEVIGRLI